MLNTETIAQEADSRNIVITCYVNAKLVCVEVAPDTTALSLIREQLGLTGAKEPCAEGDCGGCTIALGSWENNNFRYKAVTSCILPAAKLHGCHVITLEGLAPAGKLHPIQIEMLEQHAVQCGFCTSGFIMSIFCLLLNNPNPTRAEIDVALAGNLCRCTGYKAIAATVDALTKSLKQDSKQVVQLLPSYAAAIKRKLKVPPPLTSVPAIAQNLSVCREYHIPTTLPELFALMAKLKGDFKIINGGTDLIAQGNMHDSWPKHFIDVARIAELRFIKAEKQQVSFGGATTFQQLEQSKVIKQKFPILGSAMVQMASAQIRNVATPAGNLVNGSPIADSACVLLALGSTVVLLSKDGKREVPLEEFYLDYKMTTLDLNREIIGAIVIPITQGVCSFEKSAKRVAVDIATVNSCLNVTLSANQVIKQCRLAFGGVTKTPALAKKAANFLLGKRATAENIEQAAALAVQEFTPLTDVRGSARYRNLLIAHHLLKHFNKLIPI